MVSMLNEDARRTEQLLDQRLSFDSPLSAPLRYAVLGGGKRLRAHLVYASSRLHNVPLTAADAGAVAIELIHAYSLVHDDLPSMDDDDLRRGQPTVHVKWDEATAILVGDALQSLAFGELLNAELAAPQANALASALSKAGFGMVEGQMLDLAAESQSLSLDDIRHLQNRKTGDLIAWAACFGAIAAGDDETALAKYARALGLAFQIHDDVLDIEASSEELGKTAGKDIAAGKETFVSHLGLDGAKGAARDAIASAKDAISPYGDDAKDLRALADFVITRSS